MQIQFTLEFMQIYTLNCVLEVDISPNKVDICIFKCKIDTFLF